MHKLSLILCIYLYRITKLLLFLVTTKKKKKSLVFGVHRNPNTLIIHNNKKNVNDAIYTVYRNIIKLVLKILKHINLAVITTFPCCKFLC